MPFQQYKKRFVAYLNKEAYDNIQGPVVALDYHSMFNVWVKLFSMMDNVKLSFWMYLSPFSTGISAFSASVICLISLYQFIKMRDLHLITESGSYLLLMTYQLFILYSICTGRKYYHNLLQSLRDDFHYICTVGQKYRERFFENQRLTFKACVCNVVLTFSIGISMLVCACFSVTITLIRQDAGAQRPLPFPFWLFGYDLHASPVYEITFIASIFFIFNYVYLYSFMAQSHLIWIREITCKADIITWNIQDLLIDVVPSKTIEEKKYYAALIQHRMAGIIKIHHSMFSLMNDYATVYKKCLLYEQTIASPILCMTSYCFAEKYESGEIKLLLLLLCVGCTVEAVIPNYLCTHLLEKVQSVSDACWDTPFWNAGPELRPYLILMMQMSMRTLPIVTPGFDDISLKTFSKIVTRAYSYFNMLRQADFNLSK